MDLLPLNANCFAHKLKDRGSAHHFALANPDDALDKGQILGLAGDASCADDPLPGPRHAEEIDGQVYRDRGRADGAMNRCGQDPI